MKPSKEQVLALQIMLNATGTQPPLEEDGLLGKKTRAAMAALTPEKIATLQSYLNKAGITDGKGNPLKEDGIIGPRTLEAIEHVARKFGKAASPPTRAGPSPSRSLEDIDFDIAQQRSKIADYSAGALAAGQPPGDVLPVLERAGIGVPQGNGPTATPGAAMGPMPSPSGLPPPPPMPRIRAPGSEMLSMPGDARLSSPSRLPPTPRYSRQPGSDLTSSPPAARRAVLDADIEMQKDKIMQYLIHMGAQGQDTRPDIDAMTARGVFR